MTSSTKQYCLLEAVFFYNNPDVDQHHRFSQEYWKVPEHPGFGTPWFVSLLQSSKFVALKRYMFYVAVTLIQEIDHVTYHPYIAVFASNFTLTIAHGKQYC